MQEKTRWVHELRESTDESVRNAMPRFLLERVELRPIKPSFGCNTGKSWAEFRWEDKD